MKLCEPLYALLLHIHYLRVCIYLPSMKTQQNEERTEEGYYSSHLNIENLEDSTEIEKTFLQ